MAGLIRNRRSSLLGVQTREAGDLEEIGQGGRRDLAVHAPLAASATYARRRRSRTGQVARTARLLSRSDKSMGRLMP